MLGYEYKLKVSHNREFLGFFLYGTSGHIISQTVTRCFTVAGVIRSKLLLGQNIISPSKVEDART